MPLDKHTTALVTWAVVYPLITLLLIGLDPVLGEAPLPLRTLIVTAIMVPLMAYGIMPVVTRALEAWRHPSSTDE